MKLTAIITLPLLLTATLRAEPRAAWPQGNFTASVKVTNHFLAAREAQRQAAEKAGKRAPAKLKAAILSGLEVTKINGQMLYTLSWTTGARTEAWRDCKTGQLVERHPGGSIQMSRDEGYTIPVMAAINARSLDWLKEAKPEGEGEYKGRKVLRYKQTVTWETGSETRQAWIDAESKRPVALDDGANVYEFTYGEPSPDATITLPPEFKQKLESRRPTKKLAM